MLLFFAKTISYWMPYATVMLSWVRSVFMHDATRMPQTSLTMVKNLH